MESKYLPLILGGFVPAILFGSTGILQKWSLREGASVSTFLISFGAAALLTGVAYRWVLPAGASPSRSVMLALVAGAIFAVGAGLISFVILKYDAPISQLSPLYNLNTLVTVLLGLLVFSEFKELHMPRLLMGTGLIVLGGWLVARA